MESKQKTSRRGGGKKPAKRLWTKKMEREYQARWQVEAIRDAIHEVIMQPVDYNKIPTLTPQELKELAAKLRNQRPANLRSR